MSQHHENTTATTTTPSTTERRARRRAAASIAAVELLVEARFAGTVELRPEAVELLCSVVSLDLRGEIAPTWGAVVIDALGARFRIEQSTETGARLVFERTTA